MENETRLSATFSSPTERIGSVAALSSWRVGRGRCNYRIQGNEDRPEKRQAQGNHPQGPISQTLGLDCRASRCASVCPPCRPPCPPPLPWQTPFPPTHTPRDTHISNCACICASRQRPNKAPHGGIQIGMLSGRNCCIMTCLTKILSLVLTSSRC